MQENIHGTVIHFTFEKLEISCNNIWWPCSHKSKLVQCLTGGLQILSTGRIISRWQISEAELTKALDLFRISFAENQVPNNCFRFSFSPSKSWATTKRVRTSVPSSWTRIMWWCSLESPVVELKYVFPGLKAKNDISPTALVAGMTSNSFPRVEISLNSFLREIWRCIFNDCACTLAETLLFVVQSHYKSCVFPYGTRWCILAQNTWHPRILFTRISAAALIWFSRHKSGAYLNIVPD